MMKFHFSKEIISKNNFAKAANIARLANCADFVYNGRAYSFVSCKETDGGFLAELKVKNELKKMIKLHDVVLLAPLISFSFLASLFLFFILVNFRK